MMWLLLAATVAVLAVMVVAVGIWWYYRIPRKWR